MKLNYLVLRERPAQFLALTSLLRAEFDDLLADFAPAWERRHRYQALDGQVGRLPAHGELANATLAGSDTKLFFVQAIQKQYPAATPSGLFRRVPNPRQSPGC